MVVFFSSLILVSYGDALPDIPEKPAFATKGGLRKEQLLRVYQVLFLCPGLFRARHVCLKSAQAA